MKEKNERDPKYLARQEKKEKNKEERKNIKKEKSKVVKVIYTILRLLVIGVLIRSAMTQNWNNVGICVLALLLFLAPSILEKRLKIVLPSLLEIIILFFIFAAQILGEVDEFYLLFDSWDDMLHTINGFLAAAIGFALIDMLNKNEKIKFSMTPFFTASFAFCFSMTVAVMWEFFEYAMDVWFGNDMQKDTWIDTVNSVALNEAGENVPVLIEINQVTLNDEIVWGKYLDIGLHDTMHDMWVNFIGAIAFSFLGYVYIKNRGKGFASKFIPKLRKEKNSGEM